MGLPVIYFLTFRQARPDFFREKLLLLNNFHIFAPDQVKEESNSFLFLGATLANFIVTFITKKQLLTFCQQRFERLRSTQFLGNHEQLVESLKLQMQMS